MAGASAGAGRPSTANPPAVAGDRAPACDTGQGTRGESVTGMPQPDPQDYHVVLTRDDISEIEESLARAGDDWRAAAAAAATTGQSGRPVAPGRQSPT